MQRSSQQKEHVMHWSNRWLSAVFTAAATLAAPAVFAQGQGDPRGPYLSGGVGVNNDSNTVWNVTGGYQMHRNFAVELGYSDLGRVTINGHPLDASALELSALGIIPLNETFSVYGKLGAYTGLAKGDGFDERHGNVLFGVGGEYAATRDLGVRLQWQRYSGFGGGGIGTKDQDVLSLNAVYHFR
jgi:OOP family OmpA-OmpF porin